MRDNVKVSRLYTVACSVGWLTSVSRPRSRNFDRPRPCQERGLTRYPRRRHLGAIAQLEERLVCIQKARGSSPLSSTGQRLVAILRVAEQSKTKSQRRATLRVMATSARRGHGEGDWPDRPLGPWPGHLITARTAPGGVHRCRRSGSSAVEQAAAGGLRLT